MKFVQIRLLKMHRLQKEGNDKPQIVCHDSPRSPPEAPAMNTCSLQW